MNLFLRGESPYAPGMCARRPSLLPHVRCYSLGANDITRQALVNNYEFPYNTY